MEVARRRSYLPLTSSRVAAAAFIRGVDGSASAPGLLLRCTRAASQGAALAHVHKVLTSLDRCTPGRARYGAPLTEAGPFGHIQRSVGCLRCRHQIPSERRFQHIMIKDFISTLLARFQSEDEEGQTLVEYGLLLALIAIIVIVALLFLGPLVSDIFSNVGNQLT